MATFQPWVIADYNNSQSRKIFPIGDYVDAVVQHLPSVTLDEIYEPVEVHVQLSGLQSVPIQIDFDASWHKRLTAGIAEMLKAPKGALKNLEVLPKGPSQGPLVLKTITGQLVQDVVETAEDLANVGRIKVFTDGGKKRVDLPELPEPPVQLRNDSLQQLDLWFEQKIKNPAVSMITAALQGTKNEYDLQDRTARDSQLDKNLRKLVEESSAKNFLELYGSTQRAKNTPLAHVSESIAATMLRQTREILAGSEKRIVRHLNAKLAAELKEKKESHIFANTQKNEAKLENEQTLYGSIAQKAVRFAKMSVVDHVYRASPINGCGCDGNKKKMDNGDGDDEYGGNDSDDYYDNYYYGQQEVYDKMQLYTGGAVFMELGSGAVAPVAKIYDPVAPPFRKKESRVAFEEDEEERRLPTNSELPVMRQKPKLVPIDEPVTLQNKKKTVLIPGSFGAPVEEARSKEERLGLPINSEVPAMRQMPKLVPIDEPVTLQNKKKTVLIPGGTETRTPINSKVTSSKGSPLRGARLREELQKRQGPKLVPIDDPVAPVTQKQQTSQINDGMKDIYYYLEKNKKK